MRGFTGTRADGVVLTMEDTVAWTKTICGGAEVFEDGKSGLRGVYDIVSADANPATVATMTPGGLSDAWQVGQFRRGKRHGRRVEPAPVPA